ncbi:transcription initiation factor TFIID subunit 13 [Pipra filicauda]|uniref:Transcription initiation factor TFIID subunit 13 n=1 Tax=Pipra filicauda TaxID=649802 RepID=A0A6J2H809_9PASS|nr:transcription initiation factor TFIID subunit 13 [Pipra filicauda]
MGRVTRSLPLSPRCHDSHQLPPSRQHRPVPAPPQLGGLGEAGPGKGKRNRNPFRRSPAAMADEEEDVPFEEDAEDAGGGLDGGQGRRKRLFSKELRCMMYGFGDDQNPYTESVDILEDLVIEFITEMTHKAMSIGRQGRVQVEDIVFLIRKDPRKFARVKDLLTMNEELKRARKAFDEANYGS